MMSVLCWLKRSEMLTMRRLTSCGSKRSGRDDFAVDLVVFCCASRRLALLIVVLLYYYNFPLSRFS